MATVIVMPKVGISVESCIITKWHKKKGDTVKIGDLFFSYETDKASVDEEAQVEGVVLEILKKEGDDVPCLDNIAVIGNAGEDISSLLGNAAAPTEVKTETAAVAAAPAAIIAETTVSTLINKGEIKVSPRAKNLAAKQGVDVRMAAPSGPYGRVIERDIKALIDNGQAFTKAAFGQADNLDVSGTGFGGRVSIADLKAKPLPTETTAAAAKVDTAAYNDVKMSNIRKVIAKSMVNSLSSMAQLTHTVSFDATNIINFRNQLKANGEKIGLGNITINDIIIYVVARVLKNHKDLNAHLINGDTIRQFSSVNMGIAVDTEKGLLVPTLIGADKLSLVEISEQAKKLAKDAQAGTISPDLLSGGTFTISNLGTFGIEHFTPVINPPQTGILGVNTLQTRVKEVNGEIKTYQAMCLSLTYDHRALDGAPASRFLKDLATALENFSLFLAK